MAKQFSWPTSGERFAALGAAYLGASEQPDIPSSTP